MKTYDRVKIILLKYPASRNSDKTLMWLVWKQQGINFADYNQWMKIARHPKSIIEARRTLQRKQEEKLSRGEYINESDLLIADKVIRNYRNQINLQKGTHIFREDDGQAKLNI